MVGCRILRWWVDVVWVLAREEGGRPTAQTRLHRVKILRYFSASKGVCDLAELLAQFSRPGRAVNDMRRALVCWVTFCFSHLLGTHRRFGWRAPEMGMISSLPFPVNHSVVGS